MVGPIWLASYPKSGNTWMRLLLANALSGRDDPEDINAIGLPAWSVLKRAALEELTLIDTNLLTDDESDQLRPMIGAMVMRTAQEQGCDLFVKLHDAYRRLPDGTPVLGMDAARAAVYILRDPRDVAVSLAYHNGRPVKRAAEAMLAGDRVMGDRRGLEHGQIKQHLLGWSNHVRSWQDQRDVPTIMIRYEDLRADTAKVLGEVLEFLQLPAPPAAIEKAVRHADLAELQRQERDNGFLERHSRSSAPFFRSGQVGGWQDVLTGEQAAAIEAVHGDSMRQFGYLEQLAAPASR